MQINFITLLVNTVLKTLNNVVYHIYFIRCGFEGGILADKIAGETANNIPIIPKQNVQQSYLIETLLYTPVCICMIVSCCVHCIILVKLFNMLQIRQSHISCKLILEVTTIYLFNVHFIVLKKRY